MLGGQGVPESAKLIVLNANAGDMLPLRRWDISNYRALATRLLEELPDTWIVFTGSPEEAPRISDLAQSVGSPRRRLPSGAHHASPAGGPLRPRRGPGHKRQRARALCGAHGGRRRGPLWPRDPPALFGPGAPQPPRLGRHRLQPLRERIQQPADGLPGQRLHEEHHRRAGLRLGRPDLPLEGGESRGGFARLSSATLQVRSLPGCGTRPRGLPEGLLGYRLRAPSYFGST